MRVGNLLMTSVLTRRGAFDIGSGATKLMIADVSGTQIVEILFGEERPVAFSADLLRSDNGCLSDEIQNKGIDTIRQLLEIGYRLNVAQYSAVATEVFRKASNGDEYLARVRNVLPGQVKILSQDDEARLGFSTGVALANYKVFKPVEAEAGLDTVVWDSGGGSFQMTTVSTGGVLDTYMGSIGAIRSYKLLVENVRGQDVAESSVKSSANPVTRIEVEQLMSAIMSELTEAPAWLRDVQVLAIGGPNSIFQLATVVIESIEGKRPSSLTLQNVRLALEHCCGKADDELRFASSYPHADPASLLLPKLCLLLSVMRKTSIRNVTPILCIGSCAGLITSEDYWATS